MSLFSLKASILKWSCSLQRIILGHCQYQGRCDGSDSIQCDVASGRYGTYTFVVNNVAGGSSCDIMTVYCEKCRLPRGVYSQPIDNLPSVVSATEGFVLSKLTNVERETREGIVCTIQPVCSGDVYICVLGMTIGKHANIAQMTSTVTVVAALVPPSMSLEGV